MHLRFHMVRGGWAWFALPLLGWSCASAPVRLDLPSDHPASPQAAVVPFKAPPNPLAEVLPVAPPVAPPEPMDHGGHEGHGGHGAAAKPTAEEDPTTQPAAGDAGDQPAARLMP